MPPSSQPLIGKPTSWTIAAGIRKYICKARPSRWTVGCAPVWPGAADDRKFKMGMTELRMGKFARLVRQFFVCAGASAVVAGLHSAQARELVSWDGGHEVGTIVVKTSERQLYYILGNGMALRYDVAVGKEGMQWSGDTFVQSKRRDPSWSPTARMRSEHPSLPEYMPPGPDNPLGVRAIYLGWSEYRIHGTNAPWSIGRAASSGCIRMRNDDVVDLFERVHIGAPVQVIQ
jgi:lipoprotein-anchoring transpeptidase ErfK/SrfK